MVNPFVPDEGWDTVPRPMGPWEAQFAQYLQPDPNTTYGSVLPVARDNTTGAMRLALPSSVRDLAQGALQLIDGPATGTVTPQATMALASMPVASGLAAGADATGNALASGPIVAYHGSPHDFNAFDWSKIGTGEGAQAYGHGMYFAGNEGVARNYRDALANMTSDNSPEGIARMWLAQNGGDKTAAKAALQESMANWGASSDPSVVGMVEQMKQAMPLIDTVTPNKGHMYQVQLNADPDTLLDWDKPLSEQSPQVQKAIKNAGLAPTEPDLGAFNGVPVRGAPRWADTPEDAEALRQAGIPGIKYLDGGSRAAGGGTHNYVMFDPATIAILRKYGLGAMLAGGGADAVANAPKQGS